MSIKNSLSITIKPTNEIHDSGYKMLEITDNNTGLKTIYDVFYSLDDIDFHLDVNEEGLIHIWSSSLEFKGGYNSLRNHLCLIKETPKPIQTRPNYRDDKWETTDYIDKDINFWKLNNCNLLKETLWRGTQIDIKDKALDMVCELLISLLPNDIDELQSEGGANFNKSSNQMENIKPFIISKNIEKMKDYFLEQSRKIINELPVKENAEVMQNTCDKLVEQTIQQMKEIIKGVIKDEC